MTLMRYMLEAAVIDASEMTWDPNAFITSVDASADGLGPQRARPGKLYVPRSFPDAAFQAKIAAAAAGKHDWGGGGLAADVAELVRSTGEVPDEYWEFSPQHWRTTGGRTPTAACADGMGYRGHADEWFEPVSALAHVVAAQSQKEKTGLIYTDDIAARAGVQDALPSGAVGPRGDGN